MRCKKYVRRPSCALRGSVLAFQRAILRPRREEPLTMKGIHLLERGNRELANVIVAQLFPQTKGIQRQVS